MCSLEASRGVVKRNGGKGRMNELKPCPFCGSKPFVWRTNHRTYIECPNLTADSHRVTMSGKTDKEAIEAWNRRHNNGC